MIIRRKVVLVFTFLCSTLLGARAEVAQRSEPVEVREYTVEDARSIQISALGNLIGIQSPFGFEHVGCKSREGYVLAYVDPKLKTTRVLHEVFNSSSSIIAPGKRDFIPLSFQGPPSGTELTVFSPFSATVTVQTRDGLFRLAQRFEWIPGSGIVSVSTTLTNVSNVPIQVLSFKRHVDVDLDSCGAFGVLGGINSAVTLVDPFLFPPPSGPPVSGDSDGTASVDAAVQAAIAAPPFPCLVCRPRFGIFSLCAGKNAKTCDRIPNLSAGVQADEGKSITNRTASMHTLIMSCFPASAFPVLTLATDDSQLTTPFLKGALQGRREDEDDQETCVFVVRSALGPGASKTFVAKYDVS